MGIFVFDGKSTLPKCQIKAVGKLFYLFLTLFLLVSDGLVEVVLDRCYHADVFDPRLERIGIDRELTLTGFADRT